MQVTVFKNRALCLHEGKILGLTVLTKIRLSPVLETFLEVLEHRLKGRHIDLLIHHSLLVQSGHALECSCKTFAPFIQI